MENQLPAISTYQKKESLESALFSFITRHPFYGTLLQQINIEYSEKVPTAGLLYEKKTLQFKMYLNPHFFCSMELPQRVAILAHEVLHFTHQHIFRWEVKKQEGQEFQKWNIAADMAINQYIQDLPPNTIKVENFKYKDAKGVVQPFPKFKTMEEYYQLLEDNPEENKEEMEKYKPIDEHDWEELSDEDKERMLREAEKVIKRTIEKTSNTHSLVPDSVKDLLQDIEEKLNKLNYKEILKRAIKKTISVTDRDHTWKRPSRRYGMYAKGTENGKLPNLHIYIDTSGSISYTELKVFLGVMDEFLRVGNKNCQLGLWHTNLYYKQKYKLHSNLQENDLESGGTDPTSCLKDIVKHRPDLSIILTDGHYDSSDINPTTEVIWIISKDGNFNHPLTHIGKTIKMEGLLND